MSFDHQVSITILTHILCTIIGALCSYIVLRNNKTQIIEYRNTEHRTSTVSGGLSENTKQNLRKIEIDSSKVVVNDMDNSYTKLFDNIGSESIQKDNIIEVVNKLSQLKKNGG